jgi:Acetyltransferase (GNAT) domain
VLSVIANGRPAAVQGRRRRGAAKAEKNGVAVGQSNAWAEFWQLLIGNLETRFGVAPVHSLGEIDRLRRRFPDNISLHVALRDGEIVAGVVIYESARVAHVQYVAASDEARKIGALDKLFLHLLEDRFAQKPFFDFGMSNKPQEGVLNRGPIEQKEGFGARAIVHDFYRLEL